MGIMLALGGFLIIFSHMSQFTYALSNFSIMSFALEGKFQKYMSFSRHDARRLYKFLHCFHEILCDYQTQNRLRLCMTFEYCFGTVCVPLV